MLCSGKPCQRTIHCAGTKKFWWSLCSESSNCLYEYCGQLHFSESVLGYFQCSLFLERYFCKEEVRCLIL